MLEYSGEPPPKRLPRPALNPPDPCELLSMSVKIRVVTWRRKFKPAETLDDAIRTDLANVNKRKNPRRTDQLRRGFPINTAVVSFVCFFSETA